MIEPRPMPMPAMPEDRARACRLNGFRAVAQRVRLSAVRQTRIELDEAAQRDARAAETDGEAGRLLVGKVEFYADLPEARDEPRRADRVEQADRRHVERKLEGLPHRHVALIRHVEIARPIAGEIGRPVLDHRLLRHHALLEGEAVYERLQGRARRA